MAKRWMSVRVELVSGHGEAFDKRPGRVMVLPPTTTFEQFGMAVDDAFARWDRAHLRMFRLADGTTIADEEVIGDLVSSPFSKALPKTALLTTRVNQLVKVGDVFEYVFDFGDDWTHACRVESRVDPLDELGMEPLVPLPSWGWGTIPDQYGRPSEEPQIEEIDPGIVIDAAAKLLDRRAFRAAVEQGSITDAISVLTQTDFGTALQQVGDGLLRLRAGATPSNVTKLEPLMLRVHSRLMTRAAPGDDLLAADLLAALQRRLVDGRVVPIDIEELFFVGDVDDGGELFVSLSTGEVARPFMADPGFVGRDAAIDLEDPDWERVPVVSNSWQDMEDFTQTVTDTAVRAKLEAVLAGRGAFARFRDEAERAGLLDEWWTFADDRKFGYARVALADVGISPGRR